MKDSTAFAKEQKLMHLYEEFLKLYEELSILNEAKADTKKLIDFAGDDLANRFMAVKHRLKYPENDLYYWIKNKSVWELEAVVSNLENTKSKRQAERELADAGATLVAENAYWKVYHITTFEAAQKYGRDTNWCITGINDYGDKYWKDYTINRGISFYFYITKGRYDPRGTDSKFALAVIPGKHDSQWNHDGYIQIYNQQDRLVNEIPNAVDIPGVVDFEDLAQIEERERQRYHDQQMIALRAVDRNTCQECGEIDNFSFEIHNGLGIRMCNSCGVISFQSDLEAAYPNYEFPISM
jgi:hypothetical protein